MNINGAIFDCDGTIVDSMGMWFSLLPDTLEEFGVVGVGDLLDSLESMSLDDELYYLEDKFDISNGNHEFVDRFYQKLRHEYKHNIKPFEGVDKLLDELYQEGIPMVVASSTTPFEVRLCLEANGLLKYFNDVIYAGNIGRGKDYPDVYYYALGRLNTSKKNTLVFEDAPCGVKTSYAHGFNTVCVHNDHDGRDASELNDHCVLLTEGYSNLTLNDLKEINNV